MPSLLIATKNAHKTGEIRAMLGSEWTLTDLCAHPEIPAPEESGSTFSQNASLKALEASKRFEGWVLADDSGLCVDALHGAPGIYSARYAGPAASDADNRVKLLRALDSFSGPSQRTARFQCVLVLARQGRIEGLFTGVVEGHIVETESGDGGFGYDPLFVPEGYSQTFGELPAETKNSISHRSRALAAFREWTRTKNLLLV
jgi:XTP/dITP diphosphohydrolase